MLARAVLTLFLCTPLLFCFGQQRIDTAFYEQELKRAKEIATVSRDSAISAYSLIANSAKKENYLKGGLQAAMGIAKQYRYKQQYEKSITMLDSVAELAGLNQYFELEAKALLDKGATLYKKSSFYTASLDVLKSLSIAERINHSSLIIKTTTVLGNIYFQMENYDRAKEYYGQGKRLAKKKEEFLYFTTSYNYCNCLVEQEHYKEGLTCLNKLSSEIKNADHQIFLKFSPFIDGARLQSTPSDKQILNEIHENLKKRERDKNFWMGDINKIQLHTSFTKYYILTGQPNKAKIYLNRWKALLSTKEASDYAAREVLLAESHLYSLLGEYKKSLELYDEYVKKRTENLKDNQSQRIHELTLKYEKEKKEAVLAAKEMELQVMATAADKRQWSLIVGGAVTFLLALIAFAIYLRHKNRSLKVARREALQASKIKSRFLDVMSHELRTPLSTIAGAIFLLDEENDPKTQQNHIRNLKFASQYLNRLIENTIVLKTLGEPKTHENPIVKPQGRPFNCRNLIEGICQSIAHSRNGNRAKIYMGPDIPEYLIGPELDLGRILSNLVMNSNKFTQNGLIRVSVEKSKNLGPEGMELTFIVEDNGQGIREDEKERIFDPFFTGKEHKYNEYPGMGLGLNLVKGLLEKYGSAPKMESVYALGTTIRFSLRFQKAEAPADFGLPKEIVLKGTKGKVLLVEDNFTNQGITQKIIQGLGYQCEVADNGKMALEKYREDSYDLVLMDILMPVMDGFEASASIYDLDAKANIVALTAVSKEKYRDLFNQLNIKTVIHKPVDATIIKKVLHDHVPLGPRAA